MNKIVKFKAIIDRANKPDTNGNMITKEALRGIKERQTEAPSRTRLMKELLLLLRFNPTKIIGGVEEVQFDEEKGELRVGGWVNPDFISPAMRCAPQYEVLECADNITGSTNMIFTKARLIACGLTEFHSDPDIPPIEVEKEGS